MPTQQERESELALAVEELRARIAKRRQDAWQPEPGETPQEQRDHWRNIAQRLAERSKEGNATGDDQLPQLRDDRAMNIMAREFLQAAERGNPQMIGAYIEEGFPVNWQSPKTGETALHVSASAGARNALRVLVGCGLCDFLLRDKRGGSLRSWPTCMAGISLSPAGCALTNASRRRRRASSSRAARNNSGPRINTRVFSRSVERNLVATLNRIRFGMRSLCPHPIVFLIFPLAFDILLRARIVAAIGVHRRRVGKVPRAFRHPALPPERKPRKSAKDVAPIHLASSVLPIDGLLQRVRCLGKQQEVTAYFLGLRHRPFGKSPLRILTQVHRCNSF